MQLENKPGSTGSSTETSADGSAKPVKKKSWPWSWFTRKKSEPKKSLDHRNYPLW